MEKETKEKANKQISRESKSRVMSPVENIPFISTCLPLLPFNKKNKHKKTVDVKKVII